MSACPVHECCRKLFLMPKSALAILAASAAALGFVFVMQYGFGHEPCVLCLWQRVPYAAAILLSGFSLLPALRRQAPILLMLCALIFVIECGLAFFHTGVELHWWLGTQGCAITPLNGASAEDLRTQLLHTVVARCDQINWTFLGLSMANYNVAYSLLLALFSFCAARKEAA
jgi:disulfide bond formation protein DsbB